MGEVDDYFKSLDPDARAAFERIRSLALEIVPDAEQGTSYGMAALRYKQKPLLGFAAAKRHLSVFPFSPEVVDEVRDRLSGFELPRERSGSLSISRSRMTSYVRLSCSDWQRSARQFGDNLNG